MNILLLNGAPRCGKDTVSRILKDSSSTTVHQEKFAMPMKRSVPLIYGIPFAVWSEDLDTAENKDYPCDQFFGKTPREVQISLSEAFLKPLHGKEVFGKLLIRRIEFLVDRKTTETVVVSDCGFKEEAMQVVEHFGWWDVTLWRIHRNGCTFAKDSRNHVDLKDLGVACYDVFNDKGLNDLRGITKTLYEACFAPKENEEETAGDLFRRRQKLAEKIIREHHGAQG